MDNRFKKIHDDNWRPGEVWIPGPDNPIDKKAVRMANIPARIALEKEIWDFIKGIKK